MCFDDIISECSGFSINYLMFMINVWFIKIHLITRVISNKIGVNALKTRNFLTVLHN